MIINIAPTRLVPEAATHARIHTHTRTHIANFFFWGAGLRNLLI